MAEKLNDGGARVARLCARLAVLRLRPATEMEEFEEERLPDRLRAARVGPCGTIEGDSLMDDTAKATLAAAVVGGYVLGRTKKGRLALTIATYLAGRRFGLEPRQLAAEGMRRLGEMPQFAGLQDQLKGKFSTRAVRQ